MAAPGQASPSYTPPGSPSYTPEGSPMPTSSVSSHLNLKRKYPFTQWPSSGSSGEESEEEVTYVPTGPSYSPLPFRLYACPGGGLSFEPLSFEPLQGINNEDPPKRAAKRVKKTLGSAPTRKSERTKTKPKPM